MIYYFSEMGNSRYVAQQVAATIGDACQEITNSGLPAIVREWIERIYFRIPADTYCFLIATYGTTTGQIARQTERLLRQHTGHGMYAAYIWA